MKTFDTYSGKPEIEWWDISKSSGHCISEHFLEII